MFLISCIYGIIVWSLFFYGGYRLFMWLIYPWMKNMKKYLSTHTKVLPTLAGLFVFGALFGDPTNTITFSNGFFFAVWYLVVGFANMFYGIMAGLGHLVINLWHVPGQVWNDGNSIVGCIVVAFANAFVYWLSTYVLLPETILNVLVLAGILAIAGGALGPILGEAMKPGSHAPAPKPSGGHGGGHH